MFKLINQFASERQQAQESVAKKARIGGLDVEHA
jgi:hypothetical protein